MENKDKIRIVSDGTPENTKIYFANQEIQGVIGFQFKIDYTGFSNVIIEITDVKLEMEVPKDKITFEQLKEYYVSI